MELMKKYPNEWTIIAKKMKEVYQIKRRTGK
jgi:hypothetical protein